MWRWSPQARAPRFEEYALYQEYQRFLPDPQVITFTDLDGKLRAIKPDVTLSIAKTAQPAPASANAFIIMRKSAVPAAKATPSRPSTRWALSAWARWTEAALWAEVLRLALASLAALDVPTVLEVSHMGFVTGLLDVLDVPATPTPGWWNCCAPKTNTSCARLRCRPVLMKPEPMPFAVCLPCTGRSGPPPYRRQGSRHQPRAAALAELLALQNALGEAGRGPAAGPEHGR